MILDPVKLHRACNRGISNFRDMGQFVQCTRDSGYTFIDNNSSVLAVAHLDTVQTSRKFFVDHNKVYSPRLDDRLGVYILLDVLPMFGLNCDILLTEDEEWGDSTAQYFNTLKQYNWMFQFDRGGTDVAMYQYAQNPHIDLLEKSGYEFGIGSYTDICELGKLSCAGFNFGTAYYDYHSVKAWARISEFRLSIQKFLHFFTANRHTHLSHDNTAYYRNWYTEEENICPFCSTLLIADGDNELSNEDAEAMFKYGMCSDCVTWYEKYKAAQKRLQV